MGADTFTRTDALTGAGWRHITVAGTGMMSDTRAYASFNTVTDTDRSGRDRRSAGQGISNCFVGHRIRPLDFNAFDIILHFLKVQRTADDHEVRQTDEQDTLFDSHRTDRSILCNSDYRISRMLC